MKVLLIACTLATFTVGCTRQLNSPTEELTTTSLAFHTQDPQLAATMQADVEATASWLSSQGDFPTPTDEPLPEFATAVVNGIPPGERTGSCVQGDAYVAHSREGFCISAPESWTILNVDGGLAAALRSTPGQAISLQPDWATSSEVCNLLIYVSQEPSASEHLNTRYFTFASREDLVSLTYIDMHEVGGMAIAGFTWESVAGSAGAIYAAMLGPSKMLHIGFSGSQCALADLLPVLETWRFDA